VSTVSTDIGTVLVVGGDELEGMAAVRGLRERGLPVRALLRAGEQGAAAKLQAAGAMTLYGDPEDRASVEHALEGVGSVVVVIDEAGSGPQARVREGRTVAEAARRAGVAQVVYIAGSGPDHHQVSCDRSVEIEEHLRALGLPLTVLRPVTLMEEIPWYWLHRHPSGLEFATPYEPDLPLPLVAADDVGAVAALAVSEPGLFLGRAVSLAGDEATPRGIAADLARALGEPVSLVEVQVEGVFMFPEAVGHARDLQWLRTVYPPLLTLQEWLTSCGSEVCRAMVGAASS
jgi:uncharacterized protein YbjT (DUF2867 family)